MNDDAGHDYERELELRGFRWDEGRRENVLQGTLRRAQRRKMTHLASLGVVASLLVATGAVTSYRWAHHDVVASQAAAPQESQVLHTSDGSTITLEGLDSQAHLSDQSPQHIAVQLDRGRGHFEVTKNPQRTFEVQAGGVTVTVVGTEFMVERRQEHTWVQVTRGTVRVSWPGGEELLRAPAENLFPPPKSETADPSSKASDDPSQAAGSRQENGSTPPSAAALLLEADAARVAGRDDEAMRLLRRVMREHPADPQARMAAFTLGRMLAAKGRNAEAMQAFADARRSGKGELAEEALARQVEVASESGDRATAQRLAADFARSYPKSSRLDAVKRMGEAR
jgi:TolA-binding protein